MEQTRTYTHLSPVERAAIMLELRCTVNRRQLL